MTAETARLSSGIYGLFHLNGAPLAADDLNTMAINFVRSGASWAISGRDTHAPQTVHYHADKQGTTLLVGEVPMAVDIALRLGLSRDTPIGLIAHAGLKQFGMELPAKLLGEWSLLHRDIHGTVTLMMGPATRDRLHYALIGARLAVAPNLFALAQLDWVGTNIDEAGLLMHFGRHYVRDGQADRTMLARVRRLEPGASIIIDNSGQTTDSIANVLTFQPRWKGNFRDALAESEALMREIMRERLLAEARPALLLSGGLDSSLLAWLTAAERRLDQSVFSLSSAAPEGSGLDDETRFAQQVAEHLGIGFSPVAADLSANFFHPPDHILSGSSGPILSNRHCLTEAFQIAGKERGATILVNGTYGEMTATARLPVTGLAKRMNRLAAIMYHSIRTPTPIEHSTTGHFHIRLSPHRLDSMPEPVRAAIGRRRSRVPIIPKRTGLLGYLPGASKTLAHPNEFYPGALRMDFPYRDVRLYRLFAGFPVDMLLKGGHDRPIVRAMLKDRLPDAIRLRRDGMPAEPDRYQRMQRQALGAKMRIPEFRKMQLEEWIDLDWLDTALSRIAAHGAKDNNETNEVQLTAIAAEFLYWWRNRS